MSPDQPSRVLIADDEEGIRFVLSQLLRQEDCVVDAVANGEEAVAKSAAKPYDLYILDMKMPKMDGLEALKIIRKAKPDAQVIMITAFGAQRQMDAFQAGAYDYFTKPFELDELRTILRRALEKQRLKRRVEALEKQLNQRAPGVGRIISQSPVMGPVFDLIRRVSAHDVTVLITGESGVGKELVAEAIHELGAGPDKPFVKVNCAAIPENLLESELFGHEKGSFTGAIASRPGKFEMASGGSILLDEIGEMPLSLQSKLLRVIQEKKLERIGDTKSRPVNIRIMTATNRDLAEMVRQKTFREDLYFRINVIPIRIPPLRQRKEDLPALIQHFIEKYATARGKRIAGVTPEAMRMLEAHDWPGNIRELENTMQRAIVMTSGEMIDVDALPEQILRIDAAAPALAGAARSAAGLASGPSGAGARAGGEPNKSESQNGSPRNGEPRAGDTAARASVDALLDDPNFGSLAAQIDKVVELEERKIIVGALRKMNFRRQETADLLGISRKSLHNKMIKYDLPRANEGDNGEG